MFEIFQQDDGLVQRLKELKAYYKQKNSRKPLTWYQLHGII